ncbi:MAG: hypothetical protein ACEQSB_06930, partial [Undibacterium sp.]
DAAFADRYEAYDYYERVKNGEVTLEGGWRVYSSGAGIGVRLIMQCFLGLRWESASIVIDPIIPATLSGLEVSLRLGGHPIHVIYHIKANGRGVSSAVLNGAKLDFIREENPYRLGAVRIDTEIFKSHLTAEGDVLVLEIE